jgi:osmotically-inducible protein OsmY
MKRLLALVFGLFLALAPAWCDQAADDRIHDQVMLKLAGDRDVKGANFDIEVKDGVVTLRGSVSQDKFAKRAESLTKKVKGVKSVVNELNVKVQ